MKGHQCRLLQLILVTQSEGSFKCGNNTLCTGENQFVGVRIMLKEDRGFLVFESKTSEEITGVTLLMKSGSPLVYDRSIPRRTLSVRLDLL